MSQPTPQRLLDTHSQHSNTSTRSRPSHAVTNVHKDLRRTINEVEDGEEEQLNKWCRIDTDTNLLVLSESDLDKLESKDISEPDLSHTATNTGNNEKSRTIKPRSFIYEHLINITRDTDTKKLLSGTC